MASRPHSMTAIPRKVARPPAFRTLSTFSVIVSLRVGLMFVRTPCGAVQCETVAAEMSAGMMAAIITAA